ncbi:MAG TPA: HEAT repeat domain-containing protein, partial [Bacteroidota bacterium]
MARMRMNIACLLVLLLIDARGLEAQKLSNDEREILWHQDQRSISDSVLYRFLKHKDSAIRKRAAVALANIQDSVTIPWLIPLLSDRTADVRAAAAFALGQIGSQAAEDDLAERLRQESTSRVIASLLKALGKSGSIRVYDDVVAFGLPKKFSALKADQAMSLARFAIRDIKSERGAWFCFDALEEPEKRTRWSALYALWRMAPHGAIDIEVAKRKDQLGNLCTDRDPDIRMQLATLMGKVRSSEARELLGMILKNENRRGRGDWRVQVNLTKAFAAHAGREESALEALEGLLDVQNDHVQITALSSFTGLQRDVLKRYKNYERVKKRILKLATASKYRTEQVNGEASITVAR